MHNFQMPQDYVKRVIARQGSAHACESFDGPRTALLVVDMQNYFMIEPYQSACAVARDIVPNVNRLADAVRHVNETLPEGLKLHHFVSLHKEFDADDGEITRTRKLRRNVVEERYAPIIEAIYSGQKDVTMRAQITYETGETGVTERRLAVKAVGA